MHFPRIAYYLLTIAAAARPKFKMEREIKAMKRTQGWSWLAVGVLALGLNGFFHDDGAAWAARFKDRLVSRSAGVLAAEQEQTQKCRLATAFTRMQTKFDQDMPWARVGPGQFQLISIQQHAQLAALEVDRARIEEQAERFRFAAEHFNAPKVRVICPRLRVKIPRPLIARPPAPVHEGLGAGPV